LRVGKKLLFYFFSVGFSRWQKNKCAVCALAFLAIISMVCTIFRIMHNFLIPKQKLVLKVVLYGITQVLCYLIKYEKNKQLISRYKYPFLKIFYRKVKKTICKKKPTPLVTN